MARAPKRCARCETLVVGRTYCDECQPIGWVSGGRSRTGSPEYKRWRAAVMTRDGWRCQIGGRGCLGAATQADHVRNVKRFPELEFAVSNGQAVCVPCHKAKTQREAMIGRATK